MIAWPVKSLAATIVIFLAICAYTRLLALHRYLSEDKPKISHCTRLLITALVARAYPKSNVPLFSLIAFLGCYGSKFWLAQFWGYRCGWRSFCSPCRWSDWFTDGTFISPPSSIHQVALICLFWHVFNMLTMLFVVFDGHLWLLSILVDTFYVVLANQIFNSLGILTLVQSGGTIFINGMMLTVLITLLLV